jgi:hypothetical protein
LAREIGRPDLQQNGIIMNVVMGMTMNVLVGMT